MQAWPTLRYEPDGFQTPATRIMGRQSAGASFLRAFVGAAAGRPLLAATPHAASGRAFEAQVQAIDPSARASWAPLRDQPAIARHGCLHVSDPQLGDHARLRQSIGHAAYSITGLTHTIASPGAGAMGLIADMLAAPVMPWDALVCTSDAVRAGVVALLDAQQDYLRWRFGAAEAPRPELPVIPLGVHADDYLGLAGERESRRGELGLEPDEVAFLFLGRLSFHAKAHPYPMYASLEAAARETGRKIALVQCGWFANSFIESAFKAGAADFAPNVRQIWLDGSQADARRAAWAASDVFVSLSDNIQETFGLSVIEAMAAGKPVIATDWDGYRQTVRHGDSGFLIPTWMPQLAGVGADYALRHAAGALTYDLYIGAASQHVSLDMRALGEATVRLARSADLRGLMGARGRRIVREAFDWPVVMRRYEELWTRLAGRRAAARPDSPPPLAAHLDPFALFASYPTRELTGETRVAWREGVDWTRVRAHPLFSIARDLQPGEPRLHALAAALAPEKTTCAAVAARAGLPLEETLRAVSLFAKWGAVDLGPVAPLV